MKVADMHCDTVLRMWEARQKCTGETLRKNRGHIDLLRLKESNYLIQNFALFANRGKFEDLWGHTLSLLELYEEEIRRNEDLIAPALCYEDIVENERRGKMSALLTVEEGGVCGGDLDRLRTLHKKGVRMVTLTWNYPNELGFPNLNMDGDRRRMFRESGRWREFLNTPDTVNGLTETGREFVEEMERLCMIPDVSHLSDAGFYDVLACARKPFVASHSNARALCPNARNMTDRMIRALADKGGVIGLNFCADFLRQVPFGTPNPGTVEDIVRHARHIADVGGIQVLGLGSDFDGIETHEELAGAQGMEKLYDGLIKGGFTPAQADKIFYGNVLALYRECLS